MEGTTHHMGKLLAEEHALKMLKVKLETCRRIILTNNHDDFIGMMCFVFVFLPFITLTGGCFATLNSLISDLHSDFGGGGGGLICGGGVYCADGERAEHSACQAST